VAVVAGGARAGYRKLAGGHCATHRDRAGRAGRGRRVELHRRHPRAGHRTDRHDGPLVLALTYGAGAVELPDGKTGYTSRSFAGNPGFNGLDHYDTELSASQPTCAPV
jgi:hypothetical protein